MIVAVTAFDFSSFQTRFLLERKATQAQVLGADELADGFHPGFGALVIPKLLDAAEVDGRKLTDEEKQSALAYCFVISFLAIPGEHHDRLRGVIR